MPKPVRSDVELAAGLPQKASRPITAVVARARATSRAPPRCCASSEAGAAAPTRAAMKAHRSRTRRGRAASSDSRDRSYAEPQSRDLASSILQRHRTLPGYNLSHRRIGRIRLHDPETAGASIRYQPLLVYGVSVSDAHDSLVSVASLLLHRCSPRACSVSPIERAGV